MVFEGITGKIKFLRVNDLGHVYGPPGDEIHTEVVVSLDSAPDIALGFEIRANDPNLPSRLAMLSTLRDAYIHKLTVGIGYEIEPGKMNGFLRRVNLSQ